MRITSLFMLALAAISTASCQSKPQTEYQKAVVRAAQDPNAPVPEGCKRFVSPNGSLSVRCGGG